MNIAIKNIGVLFLSLVIVFASGGYNLFKHQCGTTGLVTTSIIIEEQCGDNSDDGNLHSYPENACCESNDNEEPSSSSCEDNHDCCITSFTFFKTDQYNLTETAKKSFEFEISYTAILEIEIPESVIFCKEKINYTLKIPPPDYGKQLLFSIHQLKIPSPLV